LFGIANQLLAGIALIVGTTILIRMHGAKFMWVTAVPLVWLVVVTFTAAYQKIFSPLPNLGFLAQADALQASLAGGAVPAAQLAAVQAQIFNNRLDAVICGVFVVLCSLILADAIRIWIGLLTGGRDARVHEAPFVLSKLEEGL
ncbi:MAG: carbon starvation CstA 5TM domain-containing protein, partial [Vicinamibacterales bacterium]